MPIVSGADSSWVELMNISSRPKPPSLCTFWRTKSQISLKMPSWSATPAFVSTISIAIVFVPLPTTIVRIQIGSSTSVGRRLLPLPPSR